MFIDSQSLQIKSTILVGGVLRGENLVLIFSHIYVSAFNICRCIYEEAEKECFSQVSRSESGGAAGHTKGPRATGGQNTRFRTLRKQRVEATGR